MNKKYIEGFSEDIVIDINNLKEKCIFLIRNIEQNAKKYKEYIKNETKEFQKIKERSNNNVIFTPENLLNNSPITILDAPWGAGKTYFIESLCKYIMNKEISLDYIEKIIVVDSWRYSISRSIPNDFIFYLVDNLASTLNLKNKAKDKFFTFLNQVPLSIVNNAIGTSLKIKENQLKELHSDKIIDSLNKYINKTILVIVDNIERIGENGWEILKTIQRLAMLNNLIFLLPMNKAKLVSEKLQHSEWKIEKYINIPFYKFKQDYVGLLKKYGLSDDLLEDINNLLSTKIDEECLSIRELDKILSKRDIGDNFTNKYKSLIFFNEIWPLQNKIKNIILKDIESFLTIIEDIKNDINSFNNLFFTNYSFHNYQPIYYNYQPNNYNVFRNIMTTIKEYFKLNIIEPTTLDLTKFIKKIAENKKDLKFYIKSIEQIEKDVDFNKYIKEKSDLVKKENKIIIDNNK